MRRKYSLCRRVGAESYFAGDSPEIMGRAIIVRPVGKTRVFVRPPGGDGRVKTKEKFYRVWSEVTETLKTIGRLYPDGKFAPLKTSRAEEIMSTPGWGKALRDMRDAVIAHKVMTE